LLLDLACELVTRAEKVADAPLPLVLNLASWGQKRTALIGCWKSWASVMMFLQSLDDAG
jgi:hypothetical protein